MNERECVEAGVDCDQVKRLLSRQEKLLRDMRAAGIRLFCGSVNSLRPMYGDQSLILATVDASNTDGGCGACTIGDDGLLRAET